MYFKTTYDSTVGVLTMASDGEALVGLWIEGQKHFLNSISEEMEEKGALSVFDAVREWLDQYFAGKKPDISRLLLRPMGSEFRQNVWKLLCEIPYGQLTTYGEIAKKMAVQMNKKTMSPQAVGGAVGHNPISIIIPCHRVVGSDGSLTGYAGGIEKKIKLLQLEKADMDGLFVPKKGTALS